jgi:hypothetical protein
VKKLSSFILLIFIISACNDWNGVPFSGTENYERIREEGPQKYMDMNEGWREANSSERDARLARRRAGNIDCLGLSTDDPQIARLGTDFIVGEKIARESHGGPGCQCIPMGDSCSNGTCYCREICPNHHGIMRGRVDEMRPTRENSLAFINASNPVAYARYPMDGGYCTGHNTVNKKFQILADFRPGLISRPAMTKGSEEWLEYMTRQIRKYQRGESANFVGISKMAEMANYPELVSVLRGKLNLQRYFNQLEDETFRERHFANKPVTFTHQTATDIPAIRSMDPETGVPIPEEGTEEYRDYIAAKVERVGQGFPAAIPGYANVHQVSNDPRFQEIMGAQVAIDWRTYNELSDSHGHHGYSGQSSGAYDPMNSDQLSAIIHQAQAYLPPYPDNYPNGAHEGEVWNENGPFQTMGMDIRSVLLNNGSDLHAYHSIEAYAFRHKEDGGIEICIKDPNTIPGGDDNCSKKLTIPNPESENPTVSYDGFPGRPIGQFNFSGYNTGQMGDYSSQLVSYCRTVNTHKFREGTTCEE